MLTPQDLVFSEILQLGVDLAPDLRDQDAWVKGGQLKNVINFHSQSRCVRHYLQ